MIAGSADTATVSVPPEAGVAEADAAGSVCPLPPEQADRAMALRATAAIGMIRRRNAEDELR
ncbi:hypothetical protein GCM10023171_36090 [Microbacterium panaciterrae]|uniref:Uncharacterized protein n=1 Tax=Microbacterium panaciterrae TaxID=985759 RepID=A0ABP8PUD3_9MICO